MRTTSRTALLATTLLLVVTACGRTPAPATAPHVATTTSSTAAPTTTIAAAPPTTPTSRTTPTSPTKPVPATTPATRAPERLSTSSRLRIDGLGPVAVGMTVAQARTAAGVPLTLRTGPFCRSLLPADSPAGVNFVLAGGDRLDFVTVFDGPITTLSGIRVGSTEADVLAAYPGQVRVVNEGEQQHRAIYHARDPELADRSLVFQVVDARVTSMTAGVRTAVEADEACG